MAGVGKAVIDVRFLRHRKYIREKGNGAEVQYSRNCSYRRTFTRLKSVHFFHGIDFLGLKNYRHKSPAGLCFQREETDSTEYGLLKTD